MIQVENLNKSYGALRAVRDLSFRVQPKEVVGFLGPNGAGKSTTLRIIAGFLGATSGRVVVNAHDIVEQPLEARACIGYMPENVPLHPELRVVEYLRFRAELKGVKRADRKAAVQRAMHETRLEDHARVLIGQLSKGYRQRVGLADALVSRPAVLILDEPTAGLDPNQIREVRALIRSLAASHTVLLSTHIMSEVESTCDRALVIHEGRLVAQGTLDELRALRRAVSARFTVRGNASVAEKTLRSIDGVAKVRRPKLAGANESVTLLEVAWREDVQDPADAIEKAVAALVGQGLGVREAVAGKATLEEVFASLTHDEVQDREAPANAPQEEKS